jgi:hypothetical protein
MTTLQKIKELLELGYEVEVRNEGNICKLFDCRCGGISYLSDLVIYDCPEKEFENSKILRIIPKKPKLLEVGRKVKVVETGKVYLIERLTTDGYGLRSLGERVSFDNVYPHEVIPVYEEEETVKVSIVKDSYHGAFIENKTYNKSEFEQAIKDLKEIK